MHLTIFVTVKVGIGGFSMGAATALYSATCAATGRYSNGNLYPIKLRAVVGLSGWLPGSRYDNSEPFFSNNTFILGVIIFALT